jgi:hypothetical protein
VEDVHVAGVIDDDAVGEAELDVRGDLAPLLDPSEAVGALADDQRLGGV